MREPERSPWKLVVSGCGGLVLAGILAFFAFLFAGQRMVTSVREQMADPGLRRVTTEALLRAAKLPDGYEARLAVSVPMLGRVAVLERQSPGSERWFLYLESRRADPPAELDDPRFRQLLDIRGLRLQAGEVVTEDELAIGALRATLRTVRGRLREAPREEREVLAALVALGCRSGPEIGRLGVWIAPDPAPDQPVGAPELSGTPADPEAVRAFLSAFRLCG